MKKKLAEIRTSRHYFLGSLVCWLVWLRVFLRCGGSVQSRVHQYTDLRNVQAQVINFLIEARSRTSVITSHSDPLPTVITNNLWTHQVTMHRLHRVGKLASQARFARASNRPSFAYTGRGYVTAAPELPQPTTKVEKLIQDTIKVSQETSISQQ